MRVCDNCVEPGQVEEYVIAPAGRDYEGIDAVMLDLCGTCKRALLEKTWSTLKERERKVAAPSKPRGRPRKTQPPGIVVNSGFTSKEPPVNPLQQEIEDEIRVFGEGMPVTGGFIPTR